MRKTDTKSTVAKPTKLEKRLQAEVAGLKKLLDEFGAVRDQQAKDLAEALRFLRVQHQRIGELQFALENTNRDLGAVNRENLELKEIARIAAMTMSIERQELASRADRLTLRIRGLGTEVQ